MQAVVGYWVVACVEVMGENPYHLQRLSAGMTEFVVVVVAVVVVVVVAIAVVVVDVAAEATYYYHDLGRLIPDVDCSFHECFGCLSYLDSQNVKQCCHYLPCHVLVVSHNHVARTPLPGNVKQNVNQMIHVPHDERLCVPV